MKIVPTEAQLAAIFQATRIGAIPIDERPALLWSTRQCYLYVTDGGARLAVWSLQVFLIMNAEWLSGIRFATWHDGPYNCATWTDAAGCRCEVDP